MAVSRKVAASTQTQALNALVFLNKYVISQPLENMGGLKRVQARHRVPVVLTEEEVKLTLNLMPSTTGSTSAITVVQPFPIEWLQQYTKLTAQLLNNLGGFTRTKAIATNQGMLQQFSVEGSPGDASHP